MTTIIRDFTKEQLIEHAQNHIAHSSWAKGKFGEDYKTPATVELARIALAALTAEPVAWTDEQELKDVEKDSSGYLFTVNPITPNADPRRVIKLYTVPPVQETGVYKDMLNIIGLLENNEWAEHCTSTVLGSLLESEITRLVGKGQPAPVVPETLPCPVHLVPGLRLGKGCKTETLLIALQRRAEYYAGLDAMTPEERAKHYANIEAFKAMLPQSAPVAPEDLRRSFEAVARLNNEMYRWTSCMSYNGSYVGEPEGLLKRNIREIERILDSCKSDKGE
ncbi:hypothetical protein AIT68_003542 [Salmonella enterica subsp. salamae]|uniref:hypothetical protein n=1 Tax=Salmonella enterica TaxID=28901 RepID=UPI001E3CFA02|nr:hypothetical protein [Salmonella enterica]